MESLLNRRCEGQLNGEKGTIVEVVAPPANAQGVGYDCLVSWDSPNLKPSWEDAGDLDLI